MRPSENEIKIYIKKKKENMFCTCITVDSYCKLSNHTSYLVLPFHAFVTKQESIFDVIHGIHMNSLSLLYFIDYS